ncbi:hypothetical protein B0T17DRAFT_498247 [Bombardia bombarda]|uniref:Uncharacterized protein n=1 Tax=Bombardia bombarda TaxID=252184 RepID=A0AA39WH24_9PEZI|nr:hypothetical protein B0T17DRAFT_498247 [Bombardia bombarda]
MKDIIGQLQSFPTGEIAYGRSLVNAPPLNLMVEGMGNVATPVSVHELRKLIKFARDERIKNAGTDWLSLPRMPTWFISADHVGTDSEEWAVYVKHAAETAGEYLGFGQHSTGITTALQGLYIWEEESLWRNFCKRNESGQIGILLIIFESAYEEGEIAIGYKNKDMFFQPAMAASSLFMIAA